MAKSTKRTRAIAEKLDPQKQYPIGEAVELAFALHACNELGDRIPLVELTQQALPFELVTREMARSRGPETTRRMTRWPGWVGLALIEKVDRPGPLEGFALQAVRLGCERLRAFVGEKPPEIAGARLLELARPCLDQSGGAR